MAPLSTLLAVGLVRQGIARHSPGSEHAENTPLTVKLPPLSSNSTRRTSRLNRNLLAGGNPSLIPNSSPFEGGDASASAAIQERKNLRLLYTITAYDRKQHIHLLQMLLAVVSMCEGGLRVRVVIYTADTHPYTPEQDAEMRQLASTCTGVLGGWFELKVVEKPASLRLEMTMQHRAEVKANLKNFDIFVYAEDDIYVELRHVLAYWKHSHILAAAPDGEKYMLGWQRFENTGISMGAQQAMWENGLDAWHAIEVGGELYVTMVNPHAGAWIATREELNALHKQCSILNIPRTANSFTRVRAGGWNMYLNCGRRKILPVADFPAFIVHHLPDKNWWQRSECVIIVPDLLAHLNDWHRRCVHLVLFLLVTLARRTFCKQKTPHRRFRRGDRSMLCGKWWEKFCRDEMQVVPSSERKRRFGVQGSCTVWRNRTSGEETVIKPSERMKAAGAIMKAREAAARIEIKRQQAHAGMPVS